MSKSQDKKQSENKPEDKAKSKNLVWFSLALVIGFIAFAALYGTAQNKRLETGQNPETEVASYDESSEKSDEDALDEENEIASTSPASGVEVGLKAGEETSEPQSFVAEDVAAEKEDSKDSSDHVDTIEAKEGSANLELSIPRIMGDPNAPLKITEHSSFTCSHCGEFHKNTFKKIKEEYIDTGKAYIVFEDFPLNAPAIHASMAARCVAEERYFDFVQLLFETQEDWAYKPTYLNNLKQNAMLAGLSEEDFNKCMENLELQMSLIKGRQDAAEKHQIKATPSFVLNDTKLISGALDFEKFKEAFDAELAKSKSGK